MVIGTVVEGPTDRLVLEAALRKLLPGEHEFRPLQPNSPLGESGAGWKGVRRWCRQTWDGQVLLDLLVIQVDADIAFEADLQEDQAQIVPNVQQPCPPIEATVKQLRQIVLRWLRLDSLPPRVVLAIPAQDTESWTFAALFPDDELCQREDYECIREGRNHPGYRLTLKKYGKRLERKGNVIKKRKRVYRQITPHIVKSWDSVCQICIQARRFSQDIRDCTVGR